MKQTNNAIKFLVAHYRAIYKNAYFKGIASAILLTSSFSIMGSANAQSNEVPTLEQVSPAYSVMLSAQGQENQTETINVSGNQKIDKFGVDQNLNITVNQDSTGTFNLTDNSSTDTDEGLLNIVKGTIDLKAQSTGTASGQLKIEQGKVEFVGNTIVKSSGSQGQSGGVITIDNDVADQEATLTLGVNQLKSFVSAKDSKGNALKDAVQGGIVVNGQSATLNLTDLGPVNLNSLTADGSIKIVSETDAQAGTIAISNKGTLHANQLVIESTLKDGNYLSDAVVSANELTLGSTNVESAKTNGIGFDHAEATDKITFQDKSGSYTLKDGLLLTRDFYKKDSAGLNDTALGAGQINGNVIIGSNNKKSIFVVAQGAWDANNNITLDNGRLVVTSSAASKDPNAQPGQGNLFDNGDPSILNIKGTLDFAGDYTNHRELLIQGTQGANATVDLTNGELKFTTDGSILLQGDLADLDTDYVSGSSVDSSGAYDNKLGYGRLFINSKSFKNLLDPNCEGILTIDKGGLLSVSDPNQELKLDLATNKLVVNNGASNFGLINFASDIGGVLVVQGDVNLTAHKESEQLNIADNTLNVDTLNYKVFKDDSKDQTLATVAEITDADLKIVSGLDVANDTLVLGNNTKATGANLTFFGNGQINVGQKDKHELVIAGNGSTLNVVAGNWKTNAQITIDQKAAIISFPDKPNESFVNIGSEYNNAKFTGTGFDSSKVTDLNVLTVQNGSSATFDTVNFGTNNIFVKNASLTINGLDKASDFVNSAGVNLTGSTITVEGSDAKFILGQNVANTIKVTDNSVTVDQTLKDAVTLKNNSEMTISFSDKVSFNNQSLEQLKQALGGNLSGGFINVGNAKLSINGLNTGEVKYSDFAGYNGYNSNVTSEQLKNATITETIDESNFSNSIGAIRAAASEESKFDQFNVNFTTNSALNNASVNNGYFISNSNKDKAGSAVVKADNALTLNGSGKIGSITLEGSQTAPANQEQYNTVLNINGDSNSLTEIMGDLKGTNESLVNINSTTKITGNVDVDKLQSLSNTTAEGAVSVNKMTVANGKFEMTVEQPADPNQKPDTSKSVLTIKGGKDHHVRVGENGILEVYNIDGSASGAALTVNGGTLIAKEQVKSGLDINNGKATIKDMIATDTISVGQIAVDSSYADPQDNEASIGILEITNSLSLKSQTLKAEAPATAPSVVAINGFSNMNADPTLNKYAAGELDGNLYVGQNAHAGVGLSLDDLTKKIDALKKVKAVQGDNQSIFYVNESFKVNAGAGFGIVGNGAFAEHEHNGANKYTKFVDTAYLTKDSVLAINVNNIGSDFNPQGQAAVTFAGNGKVVGETGGYVLLDGNVFANNKYNLFAQENGSSVTVANGDTTLPSNWEGIEVRTANGLLSGVLKNGSTNQVELTLNKDYQSILNSASKPVIDTLAKYVTQDSDLATTGRQPFDPQNPNQQFTNNFLTQASQTNGSAAEVASRLGVYGGAVQAAQVVSTTTTDVISSRMGVGSNGTTAISFAENPDGATMWLSAVHRSLESSGFEAEGVKYGANAEASGVALGGDFKTAFGATVGMMVNIGSGSSDGKNTADEINNDFDYYSFGAYGGYRFNQIDLLADVSFSQISNEIAAPTNVESIKAEMDSQLISAGVTAQYQLDYKNYSLKPHVGLRYNMLKLEDYTVKGSENIAKYDADSMNYFSAPVGIILSSEYISGAWTFQPSIDLTVAYNFGDDCSNGSVAWAGIPLQTNVQTQVLDDITYGINGGIMGSSKNKTFGLGIGYTGSSNTSSIGLKATFKYDF